MNPNIITHLDSDGKFHREDGPAYIKEGMVEKWYRHGQLHREDGPARTWGSNAYGSTNKEYYLEGQKLSLKEWVQERLKVVPTGVKHVNDLLNTIKYYSIVDEEVVLHNEVGPAYIGPDGTKVWWICGKMHREDGPAIVGGGNANSYYYLNGECMKKEVWEDIVNKLQET